MCKCPSHETPATLRSLSFTFDGLGGGKLKVGAVRVQEEGSQDKRCLPEKKISNENERERECLL
jgi:hypothetical protein